MNSNLKRAFYLFSSSHVLTEHRNSSDQNLVPEPALCFLKPSTLLTYNINTILYFSNTDKNIFCNLPSYQVKTAAISGHVKESIAQTKAPVPLP